ncbi:TadE/TadG family type IV pilus assembly protein [Methylobacterium sp. NPDC080182]|uniref:TadE/TadG family type IV pilus assembly protein n=1 Tax=Methylobacterium sp. NPDC080182 TaxID=3390590 RepID=UPI003D037B12
METDQALSHKRVANSTFRRNQSGAAALEFAMISPLILVAMLEVFQGAAYLYCSAAVERATSLATRTIMVGSLTPEASTAAGFKSTALCPALMPGLSCANVIISLQTATVGPSAPGYAAFVKADLSGLLPANMDSNQATYCAGSAGAYQYLQVFYALPLISPIWKLISGQNWNGKIVTFVRSAAAFRNEPYTGTSVTTSCP